MTQQTLFLPKLEPTAPADWQNNARQTCNEIIEVFNQWQLEKPMSENERARVKRYIDYGKQTIDRDSEIAHDCLKQMSDFIDELEKQ